uniref:Uncharacterized protein n=1 Tax=Spongospora subterranea TaxID=70186 RepID=A0A0H5QWI6_9EUKA|eukprot:CRZ06320.1 hypothetical protein [Spongospora subterranea]
MRSIKYWFCWDISSLLGISLECSPRDSPSQTGNHLGVKADGLYLHLRYPLIVIPEEILHRHSDNLTLAVPEIVHHYFEGSMTLMLAILFRYWGIASIAESQSLLGSEVYTRFACVAHSSNLDN